jgi:predicted RNA-binding Zn-ribbon protein involved in translation (DUF1610 family)
LIVFKQPGPIMTASTVTVRVRPIFRFLWTVVAYSLAVPLMLVGLVMAIVSRFRMTTNAITCPDCKRALIVKDTVAAATCPQCGTAIQRIDGAGTA